MKVTIAHGGTLVPVLVTTEADSATLAPEHAEHLGRLVAAVGPLEGAAGGAPPGRRAPAQPDRGAYRVTIDDGAAVRSVVVQEADAPAPLAGADRLRCPGSRHDDADGAAREQGARLELRPPRDTRRAGGRWAPRGGRPASREGRRRCRRPFPIAVVARATLARQWPRRPSEIAWPRSRTAASRVESGRRSNCSSIVRRIEVVS